MLQQGTAVILSGTKTMRQNYFHSSTSYLLIFGSERRWLQKFNFRDGTGMGGKDLFKNCFLFLSKKPVPNTECAFSFYFLLSSYSVEQTVVPDLSAGRPTQHNPQWGYCVIRLIEVKPSCHCWLFSARPKPKSEASFHDVSIQQQHSAGIRAQTCLVHTETHLPVFPLSTSLSLYHTSNTLVEPSCKALTRGIPLKLLPEHVRRTVRTLFFTQAKDRKFLSIFFGINSFIGSTFDLLKTWVNIAITLWSFVFFFSWW